MHLQMPLAGGRASRAAEATAVHDTLGLKVGRGALSALEPLPVRLVALLLKEHRHATVCLCLTSSVVIAVF